MKLCPSCGEDKPLSEYHKDEYTLDKKCSWCKCCKNQVARRNYKENRASRLEAGMKRLYGITRQDYDAMYEAQEGRCLGCLRHQSELKKTLNVDHCHTTGAVRGLLCHNCNLALGHINDDPQTLSRLSDYLRTVTD